MALEEFKRTGLKDNSVCTSDFSVKEKSDCQTNWESDLMLISGIYWAKRIFKLIMMFTGGGGVQVTRKMMTNNQRKSFSLRIERN